MFWLRIRWYTYVHVLVFWTTLVPVVVGGSGIFSHRFNVLAKLGFSFDICNCSWRNRVKRFFLFVLYKDGDDNVNVDAMPLAIPLNMLLSMPLSMPLAIPVVSSVVLPLALDLGPCINHSPKTVIEVYVSMMEQWYLYFVIVPPKRNNTDHVDFGLSFVLWKRLSSNGTDNNSHLR